MLSPVKEWQPIRKKIEAVEDWPTPRVVRDVRAFLGLASYYRKFVRSFAEIAAPLHRLTGKTGPLNGQMNVKNRSNG
jgi:hypothetical protein